MSDSNRQARRKQIIDAVVRVTTTGGLQAATFRSIAEEAGVSVRLVQYYFGTKDQLLADTLLEVGQRSIHRISQAIDDLGPDPSPKEKITTILEQFLPLDDERREVMLVFIALRTASLTDATLSGSDKTGLDKSRIQTIRTELEHAVANGGARPGLDASPETVMLVGTMTGIANGLLAGTFTRDESQGFLHYAIDLSIPNG
ncbi:MAG TPA: TetR/AcrR family transcriptional regulator [Acidimicrobiia bacterium]|nr:TetR/AcrR family transcriptional regulator [Acidimicrobiia bacterium]